MLALQGVLPNAPSALRAALGLITLAIAYLAARCYYRLFLHPLAKYPGPRFAAMSSIWKRKRDASGKGVFIMRELHRIYGDVVRIGPNELSFATVEAYRDIYGHIGQDRKRFLKSDVYERPEPRITSVRDPAEHTVQRRALSHAFSARALRDQEEVVHEYLDLLIQQLGKLGESGRKGMNVTAAYNWLTFDIIGDLAFGEPFGSTAEASDEWVNGIIHWVLYASMSYAMQKQLWLRLLIPILWGAKLPAMRAAADKYSALSHKKALKRLEMGDSLQRQDFFSHLIKKQEITAGYLMGNAQTLIVAGSETTATALTAITFYLLQQPACLAALAAEVRGAFAAPRDITGDSTAGCAYLHGVIEEGLRLSPPVALGLPRDCPGAPVNGDFVPEGVTVSCDNYTLARHPRYWQDPEAFRPERWIGDGLAGDDKRAFQPFSTGPRACLGVNLAYLEMRVTLAKIILAYDLELETTGIEDWNSACTIFGLWQKPDLLVKFHPREKVS